MRSRVDEECMNAWLEREALRGGYDPPASSYDEAAHDAWLARERPRSEEDEVREAFHDELELRLPAEDDARLACDICDDDGTIRDKNDFQYWCRHPGYGPLVDGEGG